MTESQLAAVSRCPEETIAIGMVDSSDSEWETIDTISHFIGVLLSGLVDLLGIVGNMMLIITLCRRYRRKKLTSMLRILLGLAVSDGVLLIISFFFQCLPNATLIFTSLEAYSLFLQPYSTRVWPISMALHSVGIFLTVYICIERWFAISRPLTVHSSFCSTKTHWVVGSIFVACLVLNVPRFFEYDLCSQAQPETMPEHTAALNVSDNIDTELTHEAISVTSTPLEVLQVQTVKTPFGRSFIYATLYSIILYGVAVYFIPICIMTTLTAHMLYTLQKSRKFWDSLPATQQREQRISRLPILIVVIFIVCETPVMTTNLIDAYMVEVNAHLMGLALSCSGFLVVVRCTLNVVVYSMFSKYLKADIRGVVSTLKRKGSRSSSSMRRPDRLQMQCSVSFTFAVHPNHNVGLAPVHAPSPASASASASFV